MKLIYENRKEKFFIFNVSTCILYNNDVYKDYLANKLSHFTIINNRFISFNTTIKEYLSTDYDKELFSLFFDDINLELQLHELSVTDVIILKIIKKINNNMKDKVIVLDSILYFLPDKYIKKLLKYLYVNKYVVINITSTTENIKYFERLIVLNNESIVIEGNSKDVLLNESIFRKAGYSLPCSLDLSLKLKSYDITTDNYYSVKDLVKEVWK